ncbi:hypothetical protein VDGD_21108 [Verticillium dahliae]|nr:hypothetical protein VDGD_21108 [Verticillium dahliae]
MTGGRDEDAGTTMSESTLQSSLEGSRCDGSGSSGGRIPGIGTLPTAQDLTVSPPCRMGLVPMTESSSDESSNDEQSSSRPRKCSIVRLGEESSGSRRSFQGIESGTVLGGAIHESSASIISAWSPGGDVCDGAPVAYGDW